MKEKIEELLKTKNQAMNAFDIADETGLPIEEVSAALNDMLKTGAAVLSKKGKYAAPQTLGLIAAKALIMRSGAPYAKPLDGAPDMKISRSGELRAMHGDLILVRRERAHGAVEPGLCELAAITERATDKLIARLAVKTRLIEKKPVVVRKGRRKKVLRQPPEEQVYLAAEPCDMRVVYGVEVIGDTLGATEGDTVALKIIEYSRKHVPMKAEVTRVLGSGMDIGVRMEALIESHGLPREFPPEALAEADALADHVTAEDIQGRFDARDIVLFTIDGDDAKDFDDAVSLERTPSGWRLGVHIADVSHYVKKGGAIDTEALRRGTSVYLPGHTLPMLPEALCNNLCSLMPDVDRLAMSLFMDIENGTVVSSRIENSVIHSRARLTYSQVNKLFDGEESNVPESLRPVLGDMLEQARLFRAKRHERGSIDFDMAEPEFTLNEAGHPLNICARVRGEAERLIEDFMLAANETVAELARTRHLPLLYRIHEKPDPDRLATLEVFLTNMNHPVHIGREPHPRQLQQLLEETAELPESGIIKHVLLRSLKRACYSEQPMGHYGLAVKDYCHFTSPIRRYPDLTVHRMLKMLLSDRLKEAQRLEQSMVELAARTSQSEYAATAAERDADDLVKAYYMKGHEGEEFDGVVSSVNAWGFFVELDNTVEGLVHVRSLDDYFDFSEEKQCLIGERSKRVIRLGDHVRVRLESVDIMACEINFAALWPSRSAGKKRD